MSGGPLLWALPLKIGLAAEADRVEDRRVRISDPEELVSLECSAGLAPLQKTSRLDVAKAHFQAQVETAAGFAEREARRGEQGFRRLRLEYPAHTLLRLHDGDRGIAVIGHQRGQRVVLGQDISRMIGVRPGVEIARQLAKAFEAGERIGRPERDRARDGFNEGQRGDDEPDWRRPRGRFRDSCGEA